MTFRVFQVGNIYPAHLQKLDGQLKLAESAAEAYDIILNDVPQSQLLRPCINSTSAAKLCFPQDKHGLALWARENGMPEASSPDKVLHAMIEEHCAEVFYSINATHHSESLMRNMPGCVRLKIGWLGSRNVGGALTLFDAIVSNFPTLNKLHQSQGLSSYYLTPSYETQTDRFLDITGPRPTDIFFAGTYSRHHTQRAQFIEAVARRADESKTDVRLHLLNSRYTGLAERTPLGLIQPFRNVRRPHVVRRIARPPMLGVEMLQQLCRTKIVINMAIDIAGRDRGNMRCFEAMSAGAIMISDDGNYPAGFEPGQTHLTYQTIDEAMTLIETCLAEPAAFVEIGQRGASMLRTRYSKNRQWSDFVSLCEHLVDVHPDMERRKK